MTVFIDPLTENAKSVIFDNNRISDYEKEEPKVGVKESRSWCEPVH
jgi:hypothetical protein